MLDFLRTKVSNEMVHDICLRDWGRDIEVHEAAVLKQLAPKPELGLLPWHPREVLELGRWEEPDEWWNDGPPTGMAGHWKRLFACTILLRNVAFVSPDDFDGDVYTGKFFIATSAATILQLVRSCVALGGEITPLAISFLLWLHDEQSLPILRPFISFGVLLLDIYCKDPMDPNLLETCKWVEEDEKLARAELGENDIHSAKCLVGLNYQEDSRDRSELWTETLEQAIAARAGQLTPEAEAALQRMRGRLSV
ncbi:MAG: hypothetical protein WBE37_09285 [Bryobacteraceae bacterium]